MLLLATDTVLGFRETLRQQLDEKNQGMFAITVSARPGRLSAPRLLVNRFCMARLYGPARRLTPKNGDFRAGQIDMTADGVVFSPTLAECKSTINGTMTHGR